MTPSHSPLWIPDPICVPVNATQELFPVRRIYCVGRNYVDHIREMREGDERDLPFFFQKPTDAVVTDRAHVPYPPATSDFQHEGELVVAIGLPGCDIPVDRALDHVFGYAAGIDFTRRDRQRESAVRGLPWEIGKSFDHSAAVGPITRADQLGAAPGNGELTLLVNGERRQHTRLDLMIWNVSEIISNLSGQYRLEPGDLIYTGTPAGVGPVLPGDQLRVRITGLDDLTISVGTPGGQR